MYYINSIKSPDENKLNVFHNASLKIIPSINNNIMRLFIELYLYADINIPSNSLILNINSNFGKFENISLNANIDKCWNYHKYFEANLLFNINESNELSKVLHQETKLNFIPSFKIDINAFNQVKLTANNSNVNWFISNISLLGEQELVKESYYYSNVYSLYDILENNINLNEINKPSINIKTFSKSLNYNIWSNFYDFISFNNKNNEVINIEWLKLNVDYYLSNLETTKKNFNYEFNRENDNENNDEKSKLIPEVNEIYTNFDYDKNEIILSDKINGYKGIFIPYQSKGEIKLTFKIDSITYYQNFVFNLNQNLFGSNAKYKIYLKSYE